jgi:hypothetical protein
MLMLLLLILLLLLLLLLLLMLAVMVLAVMVFTIIRLRRVKDVVERRLCLAAGGRGHIRGERFDRVITSAKTDRTAGRRSRRISAGRRGTCCRRRWRQLLRCWRSRIRSAGVASR